MNIVFTTGLGDRGSIPGRVILETQKMVLDAALLSTQNYKVMIKGKVEQTKEWSSVLPYTLVWLLLKRDRSGHPRLRSPTLLSLQGRVASSPTPWCGCYWKGSIRITLDYGRQLTTHYMSNSSIWLSGPIAPGSEWTWERWQWRGIPHSPKLQHYENLTIRLFSVISRTRVVVMGVVLHLCRESVGVFYSPNNFSKERVGDFVKI